LLLGFWPPLPAAPPELEPPELEPPELAPPVPLPPPVPASLVGTHAVP